MNSFHKGPWPNSGSGGIWVLRGGLLRGAVVHRHSPAQEGHEGCSRQAEPSALFPGVYRHSLGDHSRSWLLGPVVACWDKVVNFLLNVL